MVIPVLQLLPGINGLRRPVAATSFAVFVLVISRRVIYPAACVGFSPQNVKPVSCILSVKGPVPWLSSPAGFLGDKRDSYCALLQ